MAFNKLMMYCFVLMLICRVNAQSEVEQVVTLDYHGQPLRSILEDIQQKTGISFVFQDQLVDKRKVTFHIENAEARKAIIIMLCRQKLSYKIIQRNCFILYEKKASESREYVKVELKKSEPAMDTSAVISKPKIISSTILEYPASAFKDKKEGKVVMKIYVNKEGRVPIALIEKSSGYDILDSSAVAYSNSLRFIPAKANGIPINVWISILFNYYYNTN